MRFQSSPTTLPMITVPVDGEIIEAYPPSDVFQYYTYDVLIQIPQGTKTIVSNAVTSTMFGGPFDYLQMRRRSSSDSAPSAPGLPTEDLTVGDRVIVMFIQGDMRKPLIIGGMPHPRMATDLPTETDAPQARLSYLGMTFDVDPDGAFAITHRGNPSNADLALAVPPVNIPTKLSFLQMLDDGSIALGDAFKQKITMTASKDITFGNPLSTIKIGLTTPDITLDASTKINATAKLAVSLASGSNTLKLDTVGRSIEMSSTGTFAVSAIQSAKVSAPLGISLEAGIAKLVMKNGQVALGTPAGEIFAMFGELLQEIITAAPTFCATAVGPGVLAPGLLAKALELNIKIALIKGSL